MTPVPYDALCKEVYSDPRSMASLLRQTLPPASLRYLDLDSLRLLPGTFIDPSLVETRTDLLYEVRGVDGCALYIYLLFEHKSAPARFIALELLRYMVDIWQHHRKVHSQGSDLPAILPLVLYHGAELWNAPRTLGELLDLSDQALQALAPSLPLYTYDLRDLNRYTDDELRAQALVAFDRLAQLLLRHGRDDDLLERLPGWREDLVAVARESGLRAIHVFLSYLGRVQGQRSSEPARRLLVAALGDKGEEAYMTWQDQLIAEGERKGETRGEARGLRVAILTFLRQRWGEPTPDALATIESATTDQLKTWTENFFRAQSPEELLGLQRA